MLEQWFSEVNQNERDLLLTRFILMKIMLNKTGQAYNIFTEF